MPKLKTHKGVAKRFKTTATGKVMVRASGMRHNLAKKSRKRNRRKSKLMILGKADARVVTRLAPHL